MKINQAGIDLIKEFEGCKLKCYADIVGVPTVGYGHVGPGLIPGLVITQEHAETLLRTDLARFNYLVDQLVKVPISENAFSALVSFAFNLGAHALEKSTLLHKVNAGDIKGAANEFTKWVRAGGKVVPGLLRRRNAERALFLS